MGVNGRKASLELVVREGGRDKDRMLKGTGPEEGSHQGGDSACTGLVREQEERCTKVGSRCEEGRMGGARAGSPSPVNLL